MKRSELVPGVCYAAALGVGARDRALGDDYGLERVILLDVDHEWVRSQFSRTDGWTGRPPTSKGSRRVGVARYRFWRGHGEWVPDAIMPSAIHGTWEEHERLQPIRAAEKADAARRAQEAATSRRSEMDRLTQRCRDVFKNNRNYATTGTLGVVRVEFWPEEADQLLDIAEIARDLVYAEGDPDPALMERLHEAVTR